MQRLKTPTEARLPEHAATPRRLRRIAALFAALSLAALTGCGDGRPSDWPDPDLGWFGNGCPDLAGTYEIDSAPGSSFGLDYTPLKPQLRPPPLHSRWSLERTEHTSVLRSSATEPEIRMAFETWRNRETYVQSPGVTVMRRGHATDPGTVANFFPQSSEHGQWEEISRECSGGWLIGDPLSEDHAKAAGIDTSTPVHLARADDGGLIAWYEYSYEASFDVWCGDGCKGFPLGTWTERRWAYWRP